MSNVLLSRQFWPLFSSQVSATLLDNLYRNAFLLMVFYYMSSDAFSGNASVLRQHFTIMSAALLIFPFFIFSSIAGDLCDKYSKSTLIQVLKTVEFAITCLGCFAMYTQNITLMLTTVFLFGCRVTFLSPLKLSLLPEYLADSKLIQANAFLETGTFAGILLGEILANVLFLSTDYGMAILLTLIVTTSAAGLVSSFYLPAVDARQPDRSINFNFIQGNINIVRNTRYSRTIYLCILGISWFWLVSGIILNEIPVLIKDIVNAKPGVLTLSLVTFGTGIGAGSFLCHRLLRDRIEATYVPLAAFGISFLLYDLASVIHNLTTPATALGIISFLGYWLHWRILGDFFLIGLLGALYHVPLYTIMIHECEDNERSRVIACHNIVSTCFMIAGSLLNFALAYFFAGNSAYTLAFVSVMFAWLSLYISQIMPYGILKTLFRWVFRTVYRGRVIGLKNYLDTSKDRLVIIANHTSWLDALILASFLPDKLTFALNTHMLDHWLVRFFVKLNKVYMIDPTQPMSMRGLIDAVRDGEKVVIFPEGRLTVTGSLMKIYEAPAMIAHKTQAKILPIYIKGINHSLFTRLKNAPTWATWPQLELHIAPAESFTLDEGLDNRQKRKQASAFLWRIMSEISYASHKRDGDLFRSLLDAARSHGRNRVICDDVTRNPMSYQQLITRCFALRSLLSKELGQDKHAGVLLPTASPTAVCFFALQSLGKIPVMVNFTHGPAQMLSCCHTAAVTTIITSRKFIDLAKLDSAVATLEQAGMKILYLEDLAKRLSSFTKLSSLAFSYFPITSYKLLQPQRPNADDPCLILFTSGSEGHAKGVVLSHANLHANVSQVTSMLDLNHDDLIFNTMPLFHSFGLTGGLLLPILSGIKTFLYPNPLHYRVITELIYDTNATILFGSDYTLSLYANNANPYDFYSLRYVAAASEKLQENTFRLWTEKFGIRILEAYGMTEAAPAVCVNTPMHYRYGSVGRFLPKIDYKLEPIPGIDQGGRLYVSGPNIMLGYLKHENPGVIQPPEGGWHDTGDIVDIDSDGFAHIQGRVKRFAKVAGEMISLGAVEKAMMQAFPSHQHAIISLPCSKRGEALVLCTEHEALDKSAIQKAFQSLGISELWLPRNIFHLVLPRLTTGKTNYPALMQTYQEQQTSNS